MRLCEVATHVAAVTVYREGARITRRGDVVVERARGRVGLVVAGLPAAVDARSVRVRLSSGSANDWRAIDIDTTLTSDPVAAAAREAELRSAMDGAERLRVLRERVAKVALLARAEPESGAIPVESRLAFLGFQTEVLADLDERLGEAQARIRALETPHGEIGRCGRTVTIELEQGTRDLQGELELDYFVQGPCWAPGYVARLSDRLDRGSLAMQAMVVQDTGEDWSGVRLTLTTAQAPVLHDIVPAPEHLKSTLDSWRCPSTDSDPLFVDFDRTFALGTAGAGDDHASAFSPVGRIRPAAAFLDYARLSLGAPSSVLRGRLVPRVESGVPGSTAVDRFTLPERYVRPRHDESPVTYVADQPVDVPSDARFAPCLVFDRALELSPRYVAVPRESKDVYRSTELTNESSVPLLEGPLDVYIGGTYVMTTSLPHLPSGGRLRLELGTEPGIQVVRKTQLDAPRGRLLSSRELRHGIRIEVLNQLDRRATVEVRERIPVAARPKGDIKVSVDRVVPPWARFAPEQHDAPGRYRWREQLEPDEGVVLSVDYTVKLPMRMWLAGGERRELR